VWTKALWEHDLQFVQWFAVVAASVLAAATDARSRRIPNLLTAPLLLAGLAWSYAVAGFSGLADGAAACCVLAAPYVVLFLLAGGGAGDAKLMGAIGTWLGLANGLVVLACVSIAAVLMALALALARRQVRSVAVNLALMGWDGLFFLVSGGKSKMPVGEPTGPTGRQKMPYGIAICVGVMMAFGGTILWRSVLTS